MHRIDNSTAVTTMPPRKPIGTAGFFTQGSQTAGQLATIVEADILNAIMMEIANVVTSAGIALNKTDDTQLWQALQTLITAARLTFVPVQQGGGTLQGNNKIYLGWGSDGSGLRVQIDSTDQGPIGLLRAAQTWMAQQNFPAIQVTSFRDTGSAQIDGNATVNGTVTASYIHSTAAAAIDGTLTAGATHVTGSSQIDGNATVNGSVTTSYIHDTGSSQIDGNATVNGTVTTAYMHSSNALIDGTLTAGATHVTGSSQIDGNATVNGAMTAGYIHDIGSEQVDGNIVVNGTGNISGVTMFRGGSGTEINAQVGQYTTLVAVTINASGASGANEFRPSRGFYCMAGADSGNYSGNVFNIAWNTANAILYIDGVSLGPIGAGSDERIKQNIRPAPSGALDRVLQLRPITFDWAEVGIFKPSGADQLGFSAQQMRPIIPSAVVGEPDAMQADGETPQPMSLNPLPLIAELVGSIHELTAAMAALAGRVEALEAR